MEEDRIQENRAVPDGGNRTGKESDGLGGTAEKGNGEGVGDSAQLHSLSTFMDDEDCLNDEDL